MSGLLFGTIIGILAGAPTAVLTQDRYIDAYRQTIVALEAGNDERARDLAFEAVRMAEAEEADPETVARLAQSATNLLLFADPDRALVTAEMAAELARQGFGLSAATVEELEFAAAYLTFVERDSRRNGRELLEKAQARFAMTPETATIDYQMTQDSVVKLIVANQGDRAAEVAKAAVDSLAAMPERPSKLIADLNLLRIRGLLDRLNQLNETYRDDRLVQIYDILGTVIQDVPPQKDLETFDPTLSRAIAWRGVVHSLLHQSNVNHAGHDGEPDLNDAPDPDRRTYFVADQEACPKVLSYLEQRMPVYPRQAEREGIGGAVLMGYHIDEDGSLSGLRIMTEVPEETFAPAIFKAMRNWRVDTSALPDACRRNRTSLFTFAMRWQ